MTSFQSSLLLLSPPAMHGRVGQGWGHQQLLLCETTHVGRGPTLTKQIEHWFLQSPSLMFLPICCKYFSEEEQTCLIPPKNPARKYKPVTLSSFKLSQTINIRRWLNLAILNCCQPKPELRNLLLCHI